MHPIKNPNGSAVVPIAKTLQRVIADDQERRLSHPAFKPGDLPEIDSALRDDRIALRDQMRHYRREQIAAEKAARDLARRGAVLTAIRNRMQASGEVYGDGFDIAAEWETAWKGSGE